MNLKRRIATCLVLCLAILGGCDSSRSKLQGKYVNPNDRAEYVELKSDGTFFLSQNNGRFTGTWEMDGADVLLDSPIGGASKCRIEGNRILGVFLIPVAEKE